MEKFSFFEKLHEKHRQKTEKKREIDFVFLL